MYAGMANLGSTLNGPLRSRLCGVDPSPRAGAALLRWTGDVGNTLDKESPPPPPRSALKKRMDRAGPMGDGPGPPTVGPERCCCRQAMAEALYVQLLASVPLRLFRAVPHRDRTP
ncbi:hypothetical protein Nans01_02080 [Nocardiopsis ansamitocini]|uniref:Uncharacterized protein n=1 Tax=Nocardiopsis ansamitocini TaxID=1670832 RepID=A0A9W6UGQ4_9ACTN|nr:hypothetical protein Nans01_02080 [Nocardiopsis ansamitocini]